MDLILVALFVFASAVQPTPVGRTVAPKNFVGNIRNRRIPDGCGCYFRFRNTAETSERHIFFSSVEESPEKEAWMNLDGTDTQLRLARKTDGSSREKIGDRSSRKYVASGIVVNALYVVTRVCPPNDENCESIDYAATFTVKKGKRTQIVKALGGCGC